MELTEAIKLTADDTRENTNPDFSNRDAMICIREDMTEEDLSVVDDEDLRDAYLMVMNADEDDLVAALDS
jgi:hypothetical protein